MTPPELRLWTALRMRPDGFKFRRQHPFGPYVLDFYCDAAKLGIEVDGIAHDLCGNPARDHARDAWLGRQGIGVLRIVAEEVRVNLEGVVAGIAAADSARVPRPAAPTTTLRVVPRLQGGRGQPRSVAFFLIRDKYREDTP